MTREFLVGVVAALFLSPAAHAATPWYWSAPLAEARYEAHYDVYAADCTGYGRWMWANSRHRLKLYQHFNCFDYDSETNKREEVLLRVKGHYTFVVFEVP
jgi:hypothetical protein